MEISDLLEPRGVLASLHAPNKKQVLQDLARRAAEVTGLPERAIFDVVLERERLGTTGVGAGVAIPHGKLPGLERMVGVFARLERPVDFESIDFLRVAQSKKDPRLIAALEAVPCEALVSP